MSSYVEHPGIVLGRGEPGGCFLSAVSASPAAATAASSITAPSPAPCAQAAAQSSRPRLGLWWGDIGSLHSSMGD